MAAIAKLNLIHFFDFYLAVFFLLSTYRRVGQYRAIGALIMRVPGRWPRLLELIKQHRTILLTWNTVLPGILALALMTVQMIASRSLWPHADLTLEQLAHRAVALAAVALLGGAMAAVDSYFLYHVGQVDQPQMEAYLDQAEHWLGTWKAPVVRIFTLGWINPRQMVSVEVQKALVSASQLLSTALWWVSVQVALRVAFGLALWLTWFV